MRFVTAPEKKSAGTGESSGNESDVEAITSKLSLADKPSSNQAEVVAEAASVSLPPSSDEDGL